MKKTFLTIAFILGASTAGASTLIDFETGFSGDETVVGDPYTIGGVTFTRGEAQTVVKTGAPQDGFVPNDTITGGVFGDFFLTDDFRSNTTVNLGLSFGGLPVSNLSFYIGDIDGTSGGRETFKAVASLVGGGTSTISFTSGDVGTGNSVATLFDFGSAVISSVQITGTSAGGTRNIGWGIDNISYEVVVPLPAGVWLMLTAFGGLGAMRLRRRAT